MNCGVDELILAARTRKHVSHFIGFSEPVENLRFSRKLNFKIRGFQSVVSKLFFNLCFVDG